ncbi:hypothetical protein [Rhodoferax sp.]|nr:hypothetical protein [Rhodoferax sp.]
MPKFISDDQIEQALLQRLQHVCKFDVLEFHLVLDHAAQGRKWAA